MSPEHLQELEAAMREVLSLIGKEKKRRNAVKTVEKRMERGSHIGRYRKRNDVSIRQRRDQGLTIRAIAKLEGVSTTAVQRSLTESKRKP